MLTIKQISELLNQLSDELKKLNLNGEMLLTGGAAMCLVHEARDMTKDIDALYESKNTINELAAMIAEREDLPGDWLNDSVKGFVGANAPTEKFLSLSNLQIYTVSAEYLLAMKMMSAGYGEKDHDDIVFLTDKLRISSAGHTADILQSFYPSSRILPKTQ